MKGVFFGFPVHGHTHPTLPVVRRLVDQGEEITYYSSPAFQEQILQVGASYRKYENNFLEDPRKFLSTLSRLPYLMMEAVESVIENELPRLEGDRYDYLIHDAMAPWGKCLAELTGLPAISSMTTFALNKRVVSLGRGLYRPRVSTGRFLAKTYSIFRSLRVRKRIRTRFKTRHPHLMELYFCPEQINLVFTSRRFQPFSESFDDTFRFVGASLGDRGPQPSSDWKAAGSGPLVFVSMGTLFNDQPDLYRCFFRVLKRMPYRVVAAVGQRVSPDELGELPESWHIRPFVPQLEVLPRSVLFISRGGMNSVSEALYFGKPLLIVPHLLEQAIIARRVTDLGAGLALSASELTPQKLRKSINELLFNPEYAAAARELGKGLREGGGASRAAHEILAYVREGRCTPDG